jgi:putative DNA primase/helicase
MIMASQKNGAEFTRLWYGDVGTDWSSADLALCNFLAFWTGKDPSRMDSLFRQSGLMRDKWDRKARTGEIYGEGTIQIAIEGCNGTYDPNYGKNTEPLKDQDETVDTSDLDKAIEDLDHDAIMRNAHILARMPKFEANIYLKRIKDKFGKDINQNHLQEAIKEARKKIAMESFEEQPGTSLDALADDFASQYGDTWAYNALTSIWYQWNGTHWQDMQDVEAQKRSCVSLDRIVRDIMLSKEMIIDKISDLDGVVRLACIHCVRSFKQSSSLINFKNGTLDINTGELKAHDKSDELTYCLPYAYDEHGKWPIICKFLKTLFPDKYARQNFMVHIGLSLIGDTKMHFACALIGAPRTGKSKALDLANLTCGIEEGQYSGKTLFDVELEGKRTRFIQNKKRIVCVDELPAESLRSEENFKNMTAHSGVEMRGICKDDELKNRWGPKIFMAMNERPEYKDTTGAIKERLVPLLVGETIPKEKRDIHMGGRFAPELGGFASSCIRLAKAALKIGYYPLSGTMKQTINAMAMANNPLKSFIDEQYIIDLTAPIMFTSDLYKEYKEYCTESGNKPLGKAKMSSELVEMRRGITHKRERNTFKENKVDRGLLGLRHRRDDDPIIEDDSKNNDSMLFVDDVDDMLTILFERRQQDKPASEEASDTTVDDVDDDSVINAHIDTTTTFQKPDTTHTDNVDIKGGIGIPIEGNRGNLSSTSSTKSVDEPVKLFEVVDDTSETSSTRRQQSSTNRLPPIVCPVCGKLKEVWNVTHWICGGNHE